jgi:hypothetical protein
MSTLNRKIIELENKIRVLENTLTQLQGEVSKTKLPSPSNSATGRSKGTTVSVDLASGLGGVYNGKIIWNDLEQDLPMICPSTSPAATKGYHKHSHSQYSGGALDIANLMLVEYQLNTSLNPDCQSYWNGQEVIKKQDGIDKLGKLAVVFNPLLGYWGTAAYEIDIKACKFVEYDKNDDGTLTVALDTNGEPKSAPLWNVDETKTSIVWDKNAKCWRLYAAFAPTPVQGGTNPGTDNYGMWLAGLSENTNPWIGA